MTGFWTGFLMGTGSGIVIGLMLAILVYFDDFDGRR